LENLCETGEVRSIIILGSVMESDYEDMDYLEDAQELQSDLPRTESKSQMIADAEHDNELTGSEIAR
jgi:hypothetical protein